MYRASLHTCLRGILLKADGEFLHIAQCRGLGLMVVITGYYANLTRSVKLKLWPGGPMSYLWQSVITSSHPTKDGRATDSCFTLIGAHQCGICY